MIKNGMINIPRYLARGVLFDSVFDMGEDKEEKNMAHYVQYLNVGYGVFSNTKEVEKWNVKEAFEEAMLLDNPDMDIRIIGFRFYERINEQIVQESGVYYLSGEVISEPASDKAVVEYFQNAQRTVPQFPIVKVSIPYLLVYPFHEWDCILERSEVVSKGELRSKKERIMELRNTIEKYKNSVVGELYQIAEAFESEEFSCIPLIALEGQEDKQFLNLVKDDGDFGLHIRKLQKYIQELEGLQKPAH